MYKRIRDLREDKDLSQTKIAKFLNIATPSFTLWLQRLNQIERLIKICKYCNCDIIITDHKNINITLTSNEK